MDVFYSPQYELELPGHIWPTSKYRLIAERLPPSTCSEPAAASWDELALVHSTEYLEKLRTSTLTTDEIATLELPWAPAMADRFRLMVGGTCMAAAAALADGRAAHIGGGLHHAFASHGEGFCPLNDVAVAIRSVQAGSTRFARSGQPPIRRAAVVDADVFTCSIHQQHNYPLFKPRSDLDIGLEDGADDDRYLTALAGALPRVMTHRPELIVYLAGADPFAGDRLGGLAVSKAGLAERDRMVVDAARGAGVPVVVVLGGGYAADVLDTVDIHVATIHALMS